MSATTDKTKEKGKGITYRLFKVAAELNIGKETIVEFLHQKGFDVPDKPTTALTQEMVSLVMDKFEKEHRQIEKQRKKVDAYHEKRVRTREEAPPHIEEKATTADRRRKEEAAPVEVVVEAPVEAPITPEQGEQAEVANAAPQDTTEAAPEEPAVEASGSETTEAAPRAPMTPEQMEEARRVRREQLRAIAKSAIAEQEQTKEEEEAATAAGAETMGTMPPEEKATEQTEPEAAEAPVGNMVSTPPKLQGLTVVGKISVEKAEDKKKKRKRIREGHKSVDISAGGANRPPSAPSRGTGTPSTQQGTGTTADRKGKKLRSRGSKSSVNQEDVARAIRETRSRMEDTSGSARQKRSRMKREEREVRAQMQREAESAEATVLTVTEFATVAELADLMDVDVSQVISTCIGLGLMVSINQRLDKDTIQLVVDEFGYTVEFQQEYTEEALSDLEDSSESLQPRAPIVTIMGHVDHGKTSLLDYIRSANVVAGEAGGITQHIGAYSVSLADGKKITFLDTPGHEAFTAMRARGAQVTDIVILIVAADDAVMPQTIEAISHAQAAGVPMVVAINKIDKPEANPERIKQQLADRGVLVEEWGGRFQSVEISAKKGLNVDRLLDTILLEAELLDLKANPDREARGVVIEAEIDKGKGVVATVLVQKGTLKVGDPFVAGHHFGRVRALMDERGHRLQQAGPSYPAQVLGFDGAPTAGDVVVALDSERDAREIAGRRQQLRREQDFKRGRHITLDDLSDQIARGGVQNLPLIIKGDVDGSVEALADALLRLSTPEVQVEVIMKSVGEISEGDVLLATASNAIIVGFHVRPNLKARKLAEKEGVDIRTYQIIYDATAEIRAALEGMLKPEEKEVVTGTVEVRDVFKISRLGTIAGCYVQDGKITRNDRIRLLRDGLEIFAGTIASLRRIKDDVREVEQGYECGIGLDGMNDIKVGDVIEAYKMVEVKRKLDSVAS